MKFRTNISFLCYLWLLCLCFHSGVGKSYGNQKHQKTEIHESEVATKTHKVEVGNLEHVEENYKSNLLAQSATSNDEESSNQERENGIESIVKQHDSELPGVEIVNEATAEEHDNDNGISTVSRSQDHKVQQPEPSEKVEEQEEYEEECVECDVTETDEGKETQKLQLSHPEIEDQEKIPQQKIVQEQEEQQEKKHSLPQQQHTKEIEEYNEQEKEHLQNDNEEQYQKTEKEEKEGKQQQKKIQEPDVQGNIQNMEQQQQQQKQDNLEQRELKQDQEQQPLQNEEQLKQHQVDTNASYNIKQIEETNVAQELEKKNTTSNFENEFKNSDSINNISGPINQTSNVNEKNGNAISKNKYNDNLPSGKEVVADEVNEESLKQNTDKPIITKHQEKKPNHNRKKMNKFHVQEPSLHPFAKAKSTLDKESKETETKINLTKGHFSHTSKVKEEDNKQDSNNNSNKKLKQKIDKEKLETEVIKTETMKKTEHNANSINNEMDNSFNADKTQKKNGNKNHEHDTLQPKIAKKTNKDQGPETIKDAIKINVETPKSSPEHKQTIEEKLVTKNENPVAEHESHKEDQIVIKLENEIVKEEDKPIEKEKQAHNRSAAQSHHQKKKYSTAIIIVCLGLIVSTILLSIVGVYYRKVSMDTHRYYGHTLLPTEEDMTLYTRSHYNEAADRYESWDS